MFDSEEGSQLREANVHIDGADHHNVVLNQSFLQNWVAIFKDNVLPRL